MVGEFTQAREESGGKAEFASEVGDCIGPSFWLSSDARQNWGKSGIDAVAFMLSGYTR